MKTRTLSLLFAFFLVGISTAQNNDNIRQAIMSQKDTDLELLAKGRSLIIEQLSKGDISALRDTKDYLIREMSEPYKVFTVGEYWLLSYWTEDYSTILSEIDEFTRNFSTFSRYENERRFHLSSLLRMVAENDRLHEKLAIKSAESYIPLTVYIDNAELKSDEREFLKLLLFSMLFTPNDPGNEEMKEVNTRANDFLDTYPENKYAEYTRKFIRYEYTVGDWGFGYDFFMGYGGMTGQLQNNFRNGFAIGIAYEVSYKDAHLLMRLNHISSKTKKDITTNNLLWPANTLAYAITGDLALEYPVYKGRAIKVMPFAGIGGMGIGPRGKVEKDYPELKDFKEMSAFNYLAGVDIRLNFWDKNINLSRNGGDFISLRYSYYFPNYQRKYDFMGGNLHTITVGYGLYGRRPKRKL